MNNSDDPLGATMKDNGPEPSVNKEDQSLQKLIAISHKLEKGEDLDESDHIAMSNLVTNSGLNTEVNKTTELPCMYFICLGKIYINLRKKIKSWREFIEENFQE